MIPGQTVNTTISLMTTDNKKRGSKNPDHVFFTRFFTRFFYTFFLLCIILMQYFQFVEYHAF